MAPTSHPTTPGQEYLAASFPRPAPATDIPIGGTSHTTRLRLREAVEQLRDRIVALSHDLHATPELAFEEHQSVARILGELAAPVAIEFPAHGLSTSFRASRGNGRPTVAILAEYDALPGLGHACGHNVIAAAAVGAFLALAAQEDIATAGSVVLIGTPAEEGGAGKALIAEAGGFSSVDAALMFHPAGFEEPTHPWLGARRVRFTFHGQAAHASFAPFAGRNALDALVTAYQLLRQSSASLAPTDRVHGVIADGGVSPGVVPERASAEFYLRSETRPGMDALSRHVGNLLRSVASATATEVEIEWDVTPPRPPVLHNRSLAHRWTANLGRVRPAPAGSPVTVHMAASTDMGNVSWLVPSIHPTVAIAPPTAVLHTPAFADFSRSPTADEACIAAATALAVTAADFLADPGMRDAAVTEHRLATQET